MVRASKVQCPKSNVQCPRSVWPKGFDFGRWPLAVALAMIAIVAASLLSIQFVTAQRSAIDTYAITNGFASVVTIKRIGPASYLLLGDYTAFDAGFDLVFYTSQQLFYAAEPVEHPV